MVKHTIQLLTTIFLILSTFTIQGCNATKEASEDNVTQDLKSAKEYIVSNEFISIDRFVDKMKSGEAFTKEDDAKYRAACYRFFKTVRIDGTTYKTDIIKGSEINMSVDIFSFLLDEIDASTKFYTEKAAKAKTRNQNFRMNEITNEYLESLLK